MKSKLVGSFQLRQVEYVLNSNAVQDVYPQLVAKGSLIHLDHPDKVEQLLAQPDSPRILMIVGAIPAIAPVTKAERMVYTVASAMLTIPFHPPPAVDASQQSLPIPTKRLFLEMAYKPRITPMVSLFIYFLDSSLTSNRSSKLQWLMDGTVLMVPMRW